MESKGSLSAEYYRTATELLLEIAKEKDPLLKGTKQALYLREIKRAIKQASSEGNTQVYAQANESLAKFSRQLGKPKAEWMAYLQESVVAYKQMMNVASEKKDNETYVALKKYLEAMAKGMGITMGELGTKSTPRPKLRH